MLTLKNQRQGDCIFWDTCNFQKFSNREVENDVDKVKMEVDKEPMDLNNSSRTASATMKLVDDFILRTFCCVFNDF